MARRSKVFRSDFMFRAKNNMGKVVAATLAIVATCPALTQAAEETAAAPDSAAADAASTSAASSAAGSGNSSANSMSEIVITAQKLNDARAGIQTQTGASTYTIDQAAIQATPGGDNTLFNQVILQAPGVVQDSFGQLHVRGEHNGLQYRLNGIILPEGISVFGQTLDPRLAEQVRLITGALPAEYGNRTAGIIDIQTKTGIFDNGGVVSVYGGSHSTLSPSLAYGG